MYSKLLKKKCTHEWKFFILSLLALFFSIPSHAQGITADGTVFDSLNEPIIGASVVVVGSAGNGTVTDLDGHFSLEVNKGAILRISYIGYKTQDVKAASGMNIVLKDDDVMLEEVVAIGYGAVKRKDVTTAVSSVSTKDLENRPIVSAAQGMQGKAAGLQISQANGQPGSSPTVRVRGTTSLNGSNNPLYVVDGVPFEDIDFLSADDIDDIQILKDASSAAIYGSRAANGVIIIGTKQGKEGVAKVSLNSHYSFSQVNNTPKVLNAWEYKELQDEIGMLNLPDDLTDQTDWKKETFRTGSVQNYQLQITNGTDKLRYFLSGGYTRENGVIRETDFERYNFRAAVENGERPSQMVAPERQRHLFRLHLPRGYYLRYRCQPRRCDYVGHQHTHLRSHLESGESYAVLYQLLRCEHHHSFGEYRPLKGQPHQLQQTHCHWKGNHHIPA